jgi:uncharacterized protein (TIGR03435 family)
MITRELKKKRLLLVRAGLAAMVGALVIGTTYAPRIDAQSQVQEKPLAFEVVSIKPMKSEIGQRSVEPGLRFVPEGVESLPRAGVTARQLIAEAYQLTEHQVVGGPAWIGSDIFSVQARTQGNAGRDEIRLMLQSLLSERFKFAASHVKKELPVFALTLRKGGPGPIRYRKDSIEETIKPNGFHRVSQPGLEGHAGPAIIPKEITMEGFARLLSQLPSEFRGSLLLDRPVVDRTGLQGLFSFVFEWKDDNDLMVALQDELGLQLESQKAELDTLVIDRIERPTAN